MESVNQIIASSPQLQSLVANLANNGISVGIQFDTQSAGYASGIVNSATSNVDYSNYSNPNFERITVHMNDFDADVAAGADPAELLYHEFDHFQEQLLGALQPGPFLQSGAIVGSASIGGYIFNFNIAPIPTVPGKYQASNGFDGLVHMTIHNDIMNAFGSDTTAALEEGLAESTSPPANLAEAVTQLNGQQANLSTRTSSGLTSPIQLASAPRNVACKTNGVSTQTAIIGRSNQFESGAY